MCSSEKTARFEKGATAARTSSTRIAASARIPCRIAIRPLIIAGVELKVRLSTAFHIYGNVFERVSLPLLARRGGPSDLKKYREASAKRGGVVDPAQTKNSF